MSDQKRDKKLLADKEIRGITPTDPRGEKYPQHFI